MKIKVITLNLWLGGEMHKDIINFLQKENPDILLLQEVYDGHDLHTQINYRSLTWLNETLSFNYSFFSPTFKNTAPFINAVQGNVIFSRFPIDSTETIFFNEQYREYFNHDDEPQNFPFVPRNLQHVLIKFQDQHIHIFNTQGVWGLDGLDNKKRLQMSQCIVDQIKDKNNVILGGDFNVQPNTQTIQNIEKYLKNIFKDELKSTFNMKRKSNPGYASAVVDMMFISSNIRVLEHYCPQVDISDHLPLVALVDLQ